MENRSFGTKIRLMSLSLCEEGIILGGILGILAGFEAETASWTLSSGLKKAPSLFLGH